MIDNALATKLRARNVKFTVNGSLLAAELCYSVKSGKKANRKEADSVADLIRGFYPAVLVEYSQIEKCWRIHADIYETKSS